jgi:hypothetical protein
MYYLLRRYFRAETYYVHLLELFHDVSSFPFIRTRLRARMLSLDVPRRRRSRRRWVSWSIYSPLQTITLIWANSLFKSWYHLPLPFRPRRLNPTPHTYRHSLITRSKATSFYLPVAIAMTVCGVPESYSLHGCLFSPYPAARSILLQLGEYFQIQEDFLSWFGTAEEVGKTRTDITGNKCSWCINVALVVASPKQRKVLEENYGRMDSEKEMRVKEIYKAIGVKEQYRMYEASLKKQIEAMIAEIPEPEGNVDGGVLKRKVFTSFFHMIYERTK